MDHAAPTLLTTARAWCDDDPDPRTRAELADLITAAERGDPGAAVDLADRFAGTLEFGTAGLRGELGAGSHRMNRAVVIRAAAGLVRYLLDRFAADGLDETPRLVVGFDARHDSDVFARDTCAVATAAGCTAIMLPHPLPTPVLAFAVRHLDADAGVMVTASHNPPRDNGYKVYLGGRVAPGPGRGVQIVPPADAEIAARIAGVTAVADVPRAAQGWTVLDATLEQSYLEAAAAVVRPGGQRALDVVHTSLHGVGGDVVPRAFRRAGFPAPHPVPEQARPDPDFPTVAFPNPEEPGALDLALAQARARGADLVIANDPDADRCAVAVPLPDGGWRMLRGDELGALLGVHLISRGDLAPLPEDGADAPVVASSIVSSQLLGRIAAAHGVRHVQTLTGFKWIARVPGLAYGYEEALGYCAAPGVARDKDGVTAALLVAELAAGLKAQGRTLLDALDDLAHAHGVHATDQLAVRVSDLALITDAMARLRAAAPRTLAGLAVTEVLDLAAPGGQLPPTDGLALRAGDAVRVVVRPSGTEPKLKCYLEAVVAVEDVAEPGAPSLARARSAAAALLAGARDDLARALDLPAPGA